MPRLAVTPRPKRSRHTRVCNVLCEKLGETKELFWVIAGLWVSAYVSGELHKALNLAHRLARIAENGEVEMRMEAQYCLGATFRFMGELSLAREHLANVRKLDYPGRVVHTRVYTALDSVVTEFIHCCRVFVVAGWTRQARTRCRSSPSVNQRALNTRSAWASLKPAGVARCGQW